MTDKAVIARRGVQKFDDEVFHFPKFDDPVLSDGTVLSDFYKPHVAVGHGDGGPSRTRQDMADECDVNNIMAKYEHTGVLPQVGNPYYADFTSVPNTLQEAMHQMHDATEAFMTLPAKVRREFDNDPAKFVDFAMQDDNLDQMIDWGLAPPRPAPEAPEVAPGASAPASGGAPAAAPAAPPPAPPAAK